MKGGKNRQPLGYTIVEVMVVLAVSGMMFVIAASFINGKQERSSFTSGVNTMASQIQDVIEQVTDGKYSDVLQGCTPAGSPIGSTYDFSGSKTQGTNEQCVFLGKLFRFTQGSSQYTLSTLVGKFSYGATTPVLDKPADSGYIFPDAIPSLDVTQATPQSLCISAVSVNDSSGTSQSYYNFGFVPSLGTSSSNSFQSASQTLSIVYSPLTSGAPSSLFSSDLKLKYAQAVNILVTDGTQSAKLVLGSNSSSQNGLNVDIQHINGGSPCP